MTRPPLRRTIFLCAGLLLAGAMLPTPRASAGKPSLEGLEIQALKLEARPIVLDGEAPERTRFGKLEWRGGVQLSSAASYFGGVSGIALNSDGTQLIAVSDAGIWLSGTLAYRDGRISGVNGVRIGPLLDADGRPLGDADDRDAEAITWEQSGKTLLIAYEHHHRIERVPFASGEIGTPRPTKLLPKRIRKAHPNRGIEAVTRLEAGPAAGQLVAFGERVLTKRDNHRGWLIGPDGMAEFSLKRIKGFDITDAASAPDGDLFVLERRFRFSEGVQMRVRRIKATAIKPGAALTGEVLLEANGRLAIDNMEGIAVHRTADGDTILTLVSDDNFNRFLQRTILLQFALTDDEAPKNR